MIDGREVCQLFAGGAPQGGVVRLVGELFVCALRHDATAGTATTTSAAGTTATGLGAGKITAAIASIAILVGGGTAGYIALNGASTTDTTAQTAPTATAPAHASLSEDALLALLPTAPIIDFDRQFILDNAGFLGTPEDARLPDEMTAFSDGAAWTPTETLSTGHDAEGALGIYIDGYPRDEFSAGHERETLLADYAIAPYVGDVNGDGANDIVTLTQLVVYTGGFGGRGGPVDMTDPVAVSVYTASAAGDGLDVLGQLTLIGPDADTSTIETMYREASGFKLPAHAIDGWGPATTAPGGNADGPTVQMDHDVFNSDSSTDPYVESETVTYQLRLGDDGLEFASVLSHEPNDPVG